MIASVGHLARLNFISLNFLASRFDLEMVISLSLLCVSIIMPKLIKQLGWIWAFNRAPASQAIIYLLVNALIALSILPRNIFTGHLCIRQYYQTMDTQFLRNL